MFMLSKTQDGEHHYVICHGLRSHICLYIQKCDGIRPICSQCVKANREAECQYHDKKQISRTQLLQQKVAKLEARLRELESEQSDSPGSSGSSPAPSSSSSDVGSSQGSFGQCMVPTSF